MRIAHVSDCFAPRTGGIETQVAELVRRQSASGHQVRVITATPGPAPTPGPDSSGDVAVERISARIPFDLPIHPRTRANVAAVLRTHRPDVVHLHVGAVSPFAWGAFRAVREAGLPAVVTVHSVWGPIARSGYRMAQLLNGWASWGAQITAVSDMAAALIEEAVPQAAPVLVVPNGIDVEQWRVPATAADASCLRLIAVMRLAPRKRTGALLRIVDEAAGLTRTSLRLVIVGDGPDRAKAERAARASRAEVRLVGRLDAAGVRDELARADVFVQSSIRESFGIAALEARTAGLPVIAQARSGTATFVVDGVNGLLADDDAGMARAIASFADDRALLERVTRNNREHPPAQAWPSILAALDAAYAKVIAG